jgi:hypothetical protein
MDSPPPVEMLPRNGLLIFIPFFLNEPITNQPDQTPKENDQGNRRHTDEVESRSG